MAVPRRTIDRYAGIQKVLAQRVDVIDGICQVTKIAAFVVILGIPIPGEFYLGVFVAGRSKKDQCESALFAVVTSQFHQAQLVAIEIERCIDIFNAYHRM